MEDKALFETEKVAVTEADKIRLGQELAQLQITIEGVEEEKSDVSRAYRVKLRELRDQSHTISQQLDTGHMDVRFEVVEEPDDEKYQVRILRKDTRQKLNTRPMTEAEKAAAMRRKQGDLFDENGKPVKGSGKRGKPAKPNGHGGRKRGKA